ncbi:hypothetical protein FKM82_013779 [Ascaphus truei]
MYSWLPQFNDVLDCKLFSIGPPCQFCLNVFPAPFPCIVILYQSSGIIYIPCCTNVKFTISTVCFLEFVEAGLPLCTLTVSGVLWCRA